MGPVPDASGLPGGEPHFQRSEGGWVGTILTGMSEHPDVFERIRRYQGGHQSGPRGVADCESPFFSFLLRRVVG